MGVDYYNCPICNEIFDDCGYYGFCGNCNVMICDDCYTNNKEKYGKADDGDDYLKECSLCAVESDYVSAESLIDFLLNGMKLTKAEAVKLYIESKRENPEVK